MFIQNKYYAWYYSIISNARSEIRNKKDGYYERHHVVPKSLGGDESADNKILLTAKEHFIAHYLLTKMTSGEDRCKMLFAMKRMSVSNQHHKRKLTSAQYAICKRSHSEAMTLRYKGKPSVLSPEAISRGADKKRGRKLSPEHIEKIRLSSLGRTHSDESKTKIASSNTGKPKSVEHRQKLSEAARQRAARGDNSMKGKKHSAEAKAKISASMRARSCSYK